MDNRIFINENVIHEYNIYYYCLLILLLLFYQINYHRIPFYTFIYHEILLNNVYKTLFYNNYIFMYISYQRSFPCTTELLPSNWNPAFL